MLWDLIRFYYSLWASCTEAFRGVPLKCFTTQLDCGLRFKSLKNVEFSLCFQISFVESFLFCSVCVGRTSHPSLGFFSFFCIFSSTNIFFFVSDKKKLKKSHLCPAFLCNQQGNDQCRRYKWKHIIYLLNKVTISTLQMVNIVY